MILLKIEGADHRLKNDWQDITISDAIDVYGVALPDRLKIMLDLLAAQKDDEYTKSYQEQTPFEKMKELPKYYGRIIELLSDIPKETVARMQWRLRTELFEKYLFGIVTGLHYWPNFRPEGIRSFKLEGKEYVIPDDEQMEAVEFAEAADIETFGAEIYGGKYNKFPMLMAVLCRMPGERYTEELARSRYEDFKKLPMDKAWEVYFFLSEYLQRLERDTQTYLNAVTSELQKRLTYQGLTPSDGTAPS